MNRLILPFILAFILSQPIFAQHQHKDHHDNHHTPHWRMAVILGHTFIPPHHLNAHAAIPSWGLDIEYWIDRKWAIGLHNDLEIANFIIQENKEETIERSYPLVLTVDAIYNPWKGLICLIGPGIELENETNYRLIRAGIEYEIEIGNHWDIAPTFFYDTRFNAYNTWSIGLGIGKRF